MFVFVLCPLNQIHNLSVVLIEVAVYCFIQMGGYYFIANTAETKAVQSISSPKIIITSIFSSPAFFKNIYNFLHSSYSAFLSVYSVMHNGYSILHNGYSILMFINCVLINILNDRATYQQYYR